MPLTCAACSAEVPSTAASCERCGTPARRRPRFGLVLPDAPDATAPTPPPAAPSQRETEPSTPARSPVQQPTVPVWQPAAHVPASAPPPPAPAPQYAPQYDPPFDPPFDPHQPFRTTGDVVPSWPASGGPGSVWADAVAAGRRRPAVAASAVAVLLVAGALLLGDGPRTIEGTFTLVDDTFMEVDDGTSCTGSDAGWGYGDISSGTTVVVEDDAGDVIATTSLGPGTVEYDGCVFDFEVEVEDADGYSVEASTRGSLSYSRAELEADGWQVDLTLGDD